MNKLIELHGKEEKTVIGLMSGTSVDAVDAALVKITGTGIDTKLKMLGFIEYPYPEGIREMILRNSIPHTSSVDEICRLNFVIPQIYLDAIKDMCQQADFELGKVDLIGTHGQTIRHLPNREILSGYNSASTLQIGSPSVLAKLAGVITVGNFRTGDVAFGGQGAPLVPYFDYILFRSQKLNRMLLNLGGIANITVLPARATPEEIIAFDTGPANMLIDAAVKRFFNKKIDEKGAIAESGDLDEDLLNALIVKDNFIEKQPPKSTGREYYDDSYVADLLKEFAGTPPESWLNTLVHFTAYAVYRNYEKFILPTIKIDELIISGGGAKNLFLLKLLKEKFENVNVKIIDEFGLSGDAKEAICFAVLANETIAGNPANLPASTGASCSTILGDICLP